MPFVRIDLNAGQTSGISQGARRNHLSGNDRSDQRAERRQIPGHTEHAPEELNFPASYLGNHYSQDAVLIQITLNAGRSIELKKAFYKRVADDITVQLKTRPDDVVINLVEVPKENWSCGFGIAQYVA